MALWSLVVLTIIGVAISSLVSPQIKMARMMEERFLCRAAAEAALRLAFFERISEKSESYDALPELTKPREITLGKVKATYTLVDEESRLNINHDELGALRRLLEAENIENVNTVISNVSDYKNNKASHEFQVKEELFLVDGVTPEAFAKIENLITTYTNGKININTASDTVLRALGFSDSTVFSILNYRKGAEDEKAGFKDMVEVSTFFSPLFASLNEEEKNAISVLAVKSKVFAMKLEAGFLNQPPHKYQVTFDIGEAPIKVLRWIED